MAVSYMYSRPVRGRRIHYIGMAAACMATLVGLAFIAAGVVRLDLLEKVQGDILAMALAIALVVLGVLSIASYAVVRAIEWASHH